MPRKKNPQNIRLDKDELLQKYGDEKVGVIELTDDIKAAITDIPMTPYDKGFVKHQKNNMTISTPLSLIVSKRMQYIYRRDAELDDSVLQPIVYSVICYGHGKDRRYFLTKRLSDGDRRLVGLSSIGIGGHVDEDETLVDSYYRELMEEIGVTPADIFNVKRLGYIYEPSNEIGKVHLGVVKVTQIKRDDIQVREPDKLEGKWVSAHELLNLREKDELEAWSAITVDYLKKEDSL